MSAKSADRSLTIPSTYSDFFALTQPTAIKPSPVPSFTSLANLCARALFPAPPYPQTRT